MISLYPGFGNDRIRSKLAFQLPFDNPVFSDLCWVEEVVEYANNPTGFTRSTLASKAPVGTSGVPVGSSPNIAGYTRTPLSTNTPPTFTTGVGYSDSDVDYSDVGDTYDPSKDCS